MRFCIMRGEKRWREAQIIKTLALIGKQEMLLSWESIPERWKDRHMFTHSSPALQTPEFSIPHLLAAVFAMQIVSVLFAQTIPLIHFHSCAVEVSRIWFVALTSLKKPWCPTEIGILTLFVRKRTISGTFIATHQVYFCLFYLVF